MGGGGFFQFLLFQFCGISLSDHNFLIAKSSAVSEDLGVLILPSNLDEADQNTTRIRITTIQATVPRH